MKILEAEVMPTIENLDEAELWRIARYVSAYVNEEQNKGEKIDKFTIFWALDALIGGADQ